MTTNYGETLQIGDWIVWTGRGSWLGYGKIVGFTKTYLPKVQLWNIRDKVLCSTTVIVRSTIIIKAKPERAK